MNHKTTRWVYAGLIALAGLAASLAAPAAEKGEWIPLFDGKSLDGWVPKIRGYALGENFADTFRVEDGAITVSFDGYDDFGGRFGHLFYEKPYSRYRLRFEYRIYGEPARGIPDWAFRNSGVMIHSPCPESMPRDQDFPISLEFQLLGGRGDGKPRPTGNLCTPGSNVVYAGHFEETHCIDSTAPTFDGTEWIKAEILVLGDEKIVHYINGKEVLEYEHPTYGGGSVSGADATLFRDGEPMTGGYISLQAEGHPVQFRNIELMDLGGTPADSKLYCPGKPGVASTDAAAESPPIYRDTSRTFEERAADLVSRMTLQEKASQLVNDAAAIPRLGIREYNWWSEGLHGVAAAGYATVFPQAIGLAATFDAPRLERVADVIGIEFRAKYLAEQHRLGGSDWFAGLTVWSPNINIFRDPRWGRGQETYGEDPYLTSRMGVAFVQGLQGDDPTYLRAISTPKHYAVHSGPEPSRHRDDIHPSPRDLADTYLPAFRATVMEGAAGSVMCSYNAVNGVPACASNELLSRYLRKAWGFAGYVVSDCGAVRDIYADDRHGYTKTPEQGVAAAFEAGMDVICGDAEESENIVSAVRSGVLSESVIDRALLRLFTARMRLGQFDDAADVFPSITARDYDTDEHRALALETAEKALVLLKNKDDFLPLREAPRRIAVIGPNADTIASLVGNYNGDPSHPVTVLDGIRRRFPDAEVTYAQGSGLIDPALAPVPAGILCIDARCRTPGLAAAVFEDRSFGGEPTRTFVSDEVRYAWEGERRNGAIRWSGFIRAPETGAYTFRYDANGGYRIRVDGNSIVDAWNVDWRPSIATGKIELQAGKTYPIQIEAFQRQDHGDERLLWAVPGDEGARDAVAAAADADLVVFVAGLTSQVEGEEMHIDVEGFAGGDRTSLDLPAVQRKVLKQVTATGTPVVLVLINGSALSINWADENLPAIIEAWYPGGQGGDAVARAIAGDFSPAGRLPVTFYRSVDDLPPFTDYDMSHRSYRYFDGEVLYPFGYGLSYTRFEYRKLRVSKRRAAAGDTVTVTVDVTNTGGREGDEVVQLYLGRPAVEGAPIRTLTGFKRISLGSGETRTVTFTLDDRKMSTVDADGVRRVLAGPVDLWVGGGQPVSRDGLRPASGVAGSFEVTGTATLPD